MITHLREHSATIFPLKKMGNNITENSFYKMKGGEGNEALLGSSPVLGGGCGAPPCGGREAGWLAIGRQASRPRRLSHARHHPTPRMARPPHTSR